MTKSSLSKNPAQSDSPRWLDATGQRWKLVLAIVTMNGGCLLWTLSWGLEYFDRAPGFVAVLGIVGKILAALGAVILLLAIRCPACRDLCAGRFIARAPLTTWFADLSEATACPRCGASADSTAA